MFYGIFLYFGFFYASELFSIFAETTQVSKILQFYKSLLLFQDFWWLIFLS